MTLRRRWDQYFFVQGTSAGIALFRIVYYAMILAYAAYYLRVAVIDAPKEIYSPIFIYKFFSYDNLIPLSAFFWIYAILCIGCMSGIGGRNLRILQTVAGLYYAGYRANFFDYHQIDSPVMMCNFIMIFANCDDVFVLGKKNHYLTGDLFAWPIRAIRVLLVLVMFCAGMQKIARENLNYLFKNPLYSIVYQKAFLHYPRPPGMISGWILSHPTLAHVAGTGAFFLELMMPLALLGGVFRKTLIPMCTIALFLFWVVLRKAFFLAWLPLCAAWLEWDRLAQRLLRKT